VILNGFTFDLSGMVALVTGASSGLGAHFANVLAASGAEVIVAARRLAPLEELANRIAAGGGRCETMLLDVADPAAIEGAAGRMGRVDILVNNAGLARESSALDHSLADWETIIDTNLRGAFLMAQAVARAIRERGTGGSIINIASILGIRQAGGVAAYAISKAGVIQLTKTLALEWARYGIRVNALAPGYFKTEINTEFWNGEGGKAMMRRIPQRRLGELRELDGPLLLLASDASAYMTGSILTIDGGHAVSSL
jgi:hypothetical protein